MSLFDCIQRAIDARAMPQAPGQAMQALVQRLEAEYAPTMGSAAAAQAKRDALEVFKAETQAKRRAVLAQIKAKRSIDAQLDAFRDITGKPDLSAAPRAFIEYDQSGGIASVQGVRQALRGRYHRMIDAFLLRHSRDLVGRVRNKAELVDVVRELHGQGSGNPAAKQIADALAGAFEQARLDFNAAGGHIGKLDDFGLPHKHNARALKAAGLNPWIDAINPRLDWSRIKDFKSGKPFTQSSQARRRAFLAEIWGDITSDGWSKREASTVAAGRALYNRRADHRLLHFKSADDWMAYNDQFGEADAFSTIVGHLDRMALDTAQMRVFGPNPNAGFTYLTQSVERRATFKPWAPNAVDKAKEQAVFARTMLGHLTGSVNSGGSRFWTDFFAGTRNMLVAARLGGAMLSALGDAGFGAMAARQIGMGEMRPVQRQLRLLASRKARAEALRMGVVAESLADAGIAAQRMLGEVTGPEITRRFADGVLRAQGLTLWTETGRHAFQMELSAFMAELAPKAWVDLPDPFRRLFLDRHGLGPADWDAIRATPLHRDSEGATFLLADDVRTAPHLDPEAADGLSLRLGAAIAAELEFAVPNTSLRARANVIGNSAPGTFVGELTRSGASYKNFALTLVVNHLRRIMLADTRDPRLVTALTFAALTTFAGALAVQLKDVAKGRDPRDMSDARFWGAAFIQGGGLGIFGDFLYQVGENRFGNSLGMTLAGPVVDFANDLGALTVGNVVELLQGEDTKFGAELVRFMRQNTPGANVWFLSLAFQRLVMDQLQRALDPQAARAWARQERARIRDYGNRAWWGPGQPAPDRAPDLTAAFGDGDD